MGNRQPVTFKTCAACGHVAKANRKTRASCTGMACAQIADPAVAMNMLAPGIRLVRTELVMPTGL